MLQFKSNCFLLCGNVFALPVDTTVSEMLSISYLVCYVYRAFNIAVSSLQLIVLDPTRRLSAEEIKAHDFFKSIDWEKLAQ